jgi:GAF domain-containing protein
MSVRAPIPTGEDRRLEALHQFGVLDTPPERTFDDIVLQASALCDAPIGVLSLIDRDRSWVKAAYGLERGELPRDVAFCSHAICQDDPLVVADALLDPRFEDNELVMGEPFVRAYAGAPIVVGGQRFGTVAVVDLVPRSFDAGDLDSLQALARLAGDQFELRRKAAELSRTLERLRTLEGMLPVCKECGQIRDGDSWLPMDHYMAAHTGSLVSHGMCPECMPKYLPGGDAKR